MYPLKKIENTYVNVFEIVAITKGYQLQKTDGLHTSLTEGCTISFKNNARIALDKLSFEEVSKLLSEPSSSVVDAGIIPVETNRTPQEKPEPTRKTLNILAEIATERERQRVQEGYTEKHDDSHTAGELAAAAACYAMPKDLHDIDTFFPFREGIRRKDRRKDLIRATALMIAEIERLDRAEAKAGK